MAAVSGGVSNFMDEFHPDSIEYKVNTSLKKYIQWQPKQKIEDVRLKLLEKF